MSELDLLEFEKELKAGKYDHVLKELKTATAKDRIKQKVRKEQKEKEKLLQQQAFKPVELPEPAAIQKNFLILVCECCGSETVYLQNTRIRFDYKESKTGVKRSHYEDFDETLLKNVKRELSEIAAHTSLLIEKCNHCLFEKEDIKDE